MYGAAKIFMTSFFCWRDFLYTVTYTLTYYKYITYSFTEVYNLLLNNLTWVLIQ